MWVHPFFVFGGEWKRLFLFIEAGDVLRFLGGNSSSHIGKRPFPYKETVVTLRRKRQFPVEGTGVSKLWKQAFPAEGTDVRPQDGCRQVECRRLAGRWGGAVT